MIRIFDFDGTIVDLWPRYHAVFCDLVRENVPFSLYKEMKKKYKRDEEVAMVLDVVLPHDYFLQKAILLESKKYLKLDRLYFSKEEIKNILSDKHLILTRRRNRKNFEWELRYLGIKSHFKVITSGNKKEWVKDNIFMPAIVIGDSVDDLRIGNLPDTKIHMVGYGLGNKDDFDKLGVEYDYHNTPDELVDRLRKLKI